MSDAPLRDWTWAEFHAHVDELCPLESKRVFGQMNSDGSSVFYRKQIRQAVIDLQHFIPEFTRNQETIYYNQDMTEDGRAHVGSLPPQSKVTGVWYYSIDRKRRFQVVEIPWEHRFDMTNEFQNTLNSNYIVMTSASIGALAAAETLNMMRGERKHVGVISISPKHDQFYLFPKLEGPWVLSLFWDGQKLDYRDQEYVPFDEESAQAVAFYVQAQFLSYVERNTAESASRAVAYSNKRTQIFTRMQQKGFIK